MAWEPYLNDKRFLKELDNLLVKDVFVKITTLDLNETPLQEIQGKATTGSINIDGSSSMRRTGSITFIPDENENNVTDMNNTISINKRVSIFVGYANDLKIQYPQYATYDIIWFPLGIYIISSASFTQDTAGTSISIQIQDKMSLLNGTNGGLVPASITANKIINKDASGNYLGETNVPIYDVIYTVVKELGKENPAKIIINVPKTARNMLVWNGTGTLYQASGVGGYTILSTASGVNDIHTYAPGELVGFQFTDFVYPDDLVMDTGTTVCDLLDKIRDSLGNYEYFYDINGNFRFQEIKNYLNTSQATIMINNMTSALYNQDRSATDTTVYDFNNQNLITSFANSPNYSMIKNDFVVWGARPVLGSEDSTLPIRFHLAIDKKPIPLLRASGKTEDWRNVLYREGVAASGLAISSNPYYIELQNEWPKMYNTTTLTWLPSATADPSGLDYFLDFIDSTYSLSQLTISNIGKRSMVVNDDKVNCIFKPTVPPLIIAASGAIGDDDASEALNRNIPYARAASGVTSQLVLARDYRDAFSVVRDLLYQYTSYNSAITLQTLPIYYLDVNSLIGVYDSVTKINGRYQIKSITVPLSINETMSITATQLLERI